jgi:hypothetical protein
MVNWADTRLLLAPDRGHHCLYAKDVERPSQIIYERRQAELGADFFETTHEKGALVHPYVDGPLLASCWAVL